MHYISNVDNFKLRRFRKVFLCIQKNFTFSSVTKFRMFFSFYIYLFKYFSWKTNASLYFSRFIKEYRTTLKCNVHMMGLNTWQCGVYRRSVKFFLSKKETNLRLSTFLASERTMLSDSSTLTCLLNSSLIRNNFLTSEDNNWKFLTVCYGILFSLFP